MDLRFSADGRRFSPVRQEVASPSDAAVAMANGRLGEWNGGLLMGVAPAGGLRAKPSGTFVDSRESFRYDTDTNSWATLSSMPIGMIQGPKLAPVFAEGRFILLLGSQERVTFRIGRNHAPTSATAETHVTYGGDEIFHYDIEQAKFGRAGKMLYGVSTPVSYTHLTLPTILLV